MSTKNIILTGFMGTGKSTLGRRLAARLGFRFVDTDLLIEERIGQTIADLFATQGEAAFRRLETDLAKELADQSGLVIATGGGLVLNPLNVKILQQSGLILCLTATPEEILERISRQQHIRPLLQDPAPLNKIRELLAQRDSCYQQFPQVSTSGQNHEQLLGALLRKIHEEDRG